MGSSGLMSCKIQAELGSKQCHLRPEPDLMIKAGPGKRTATPLNAGLCQRPPSLGAEPLPGGPCVVAWSSLPREPGF